MSYYGVLYPDFWTGHTGRELRSRGGKDAQLLALYLISNRHANMLGLYRARPEDIRHESGLGLKAMARAFSALEHSAFAVFDAATAYVWVRQMVRFRLRLTAGETLSADDNRAKAADRLYQSIDPNPFLGDFFDCNQPVLRLSKRRDASGLVVSLTDVHHMSPFGTPSRPLRSQVQRSVRTQVQGSEIREQSAENSDQGGRTYVVPIDRARSNKLRPLRK